MYFIKSEYIRFLKDLGLIKPPVFWLVINALAGPPIAPSNVPAGFVIIPEAWAILINVFLFGDQSFDALIKLEN